MKCRNGFVSNSSSSSFIVAFPKDIEMTEAAVKKYLFQEDEFLYNYDDRMATKKSEEIILEEMKKQKPNDIENIRDNCNGWLDGALTTKIIDIKMESLIIKAGVKH